MILAFRLQETVDKFKMEFLLYGMEISWPYTHLGLWPKSNLWKYR